MTLSRILHNVAMSDLTDHNRKAWDAKVDQQDRWTIPVGPEEMAAARQGRVEILLTPSKPVPKDWLPELSRLPVLCLASGGGQQGPILAAAGAIVTVLDNSPKQLQQDRLVADREGLDIETVQGEMTDLSMFADGQFDLIVHPCANAFIPDLCPLWREAFRVLSHGGVLLAGFTNPVRYLFDHRRYEAGELIVRHSIPYSDLSSLGDDERQRLIDAGEPLEFGHSLEDQIGGQLDAGFVLRGFYEDRYPAESDDALSRIMPTLIATRAVKP